MKILKISQFELQDVDIQDDIEYRKSALKAKCIKDINSVVENFISKYKENFMGRHDGYVFDKTVDGDKIGDSKLNSFNYENKIDEAKRILLINIRDSFKYSEN